MNQFFTFGKGAAKSWEKVQSPNAPLFFSFTNIYKK